MKRTLLIISMIILILIPSSLAYWQEPGNEPEPVTASIDVNIGYFPFQSLDGIPEYDENNKYKNNQILSKDGIIYVVKNEKTCYTNENCPPPGSVTDAYNNPYREATIEWRESSYYKKGETIVHEGILYFLENEWGGPINPSNTSSARGWIPLNAGKFIPGRFYFKNTFIIHQNSIYRIDKDNEYASIESFKPDNSVIFKDSYISTKKYKQNEAEFHEGHAFYVVNADKANTNAPGTSHGAWNRIDTLDWVSTNYYAKNSAVWYKGNLYTASVENPTHAPETAIRQWNLMGTVYYQQFNTYAKDVNVVYKGKIYRSMVENSGVIPGTDSKVWSPS